MTVYHSAMCGVPRVAVEDTPLFWTVFDSGISLGAFNRVTGTNIKQNVSGTDGVTEYVLSDFLTTTYGAGTLLDIQTIPNVTIPDEADYNVKHTNQIEACASPSYPGGQQLQLQCDELTGGLTSTPNPQSVLTATITAAAALADPLTEQYWCVDVYVPAGLDLQSGNTTTGKFYVLTEYKTGGYDDAGVLKNGIGDLRVRVAILGDDGTGIDKYNLTIDNNANGRGVIAEVGSPLVEFYSDYNAATVRTGCWTKVHFYFKLPANKDDLTTGILQIVIEPEGYDPVVLADIHGGVQMMGAVNLPITRIYYALNYTTATLPAPTEVRNLEVWTRPPRNLV